MTVTLAASPAKLIPVFGCVAIGAIFIAAGLGKIVDPVRVSLSISRYEVLPSFAVPIAGALLGPLEIVFGIALVLLRRPVVMLPVAAMLGGFVILQVQAVARGIDAPCGCGALKLFGDAGGESEIGFVSVARTSAMLGIVAFGYWISERGTRKAGSTGVIVK